MLNPDWNDPKAPDRFRKNISKRWSSDTVQYFEKFIDRAEYAKSMTRVINMYLPEIKKGGNRILDMSCGSGAFLEIARSYGNVIQGTDEPFCVYLPLLKSQEVPYLPVDGRKLPYPIENKSFDVVTSMHAIFFIRESLWEDVIKEYCRISCKTILVATTAEKKFDRGNEILSKLTSPAPGWKLTKIHDKTHFKWECNGY